MPALWHKKKHTVQGTYSVPLHRMLAVVDVSKKELTGVIGSQSVCGGREITDIGIFLQRVMLLSVIFL